MKFISIIICALLALSQSLMAYPCCCPPLAEKGYIKIAPGATFPMKPHVCAPAPVWDPAIQGYDSNFGTRTNFGLAVGYEVCPWAALEANLTYRGQFRYKKFQTPPQGVQTDLAAKTRRFNMDILTTMGSLFLQGRGLDLSWDMCSGSIYPILGGGAGTSRILLFDFRSTGLAPTDNNAPLLSFGSENQYYVAWRFSYQLSAGLEYRYCDCWAVAVSYRWFDAGRFKGPRYFREPTGETFDVGNERWKMDLRANEVVVDLKVFF